MITLGGLNDISRVRHGFMTRRGGVSEGIYESLNCGFGSDDDPAKVVENRAIAMRRLDQPPEALVTVSQVHSADVVTVLDAWTPAQAPRADAMVTDRPGIVLGVLAADCAPVLLAAGGARIIGAAHAGWRGAIGGVLEATVAAMVALGARRGDLVAAVGPCIGCRSYEVGSEFPAPFLEDDPPNADFFSPAPSEGKHLFDLQGYVARRIGRAGVDLIHIYPGDTVTEEDRFFSYRRARLRGEPDYGRGLSAIVLVD